MSTRGSLNAQGSLEVRVTKLVQDTTIAKIIHMVEEAQGKRAPTQAFVDKFAAIYTPIVMALAVGIVFIPSSLYGSGLGAVDLSRARAPGCRVSLRLGGIHAGCYRKRHFQCRKTRSSHQRRNPPSRKPALSAPSRLTRPER